MAKETEFSCSFKFELKNFDQRSKDRFLYLLTQGDELIELDEALYEYSRKMFKDRTLGELRDRYLVEISRSPLKGLQIVEFFTDSGRYFMKPADLHFDEGVSELPRYSVARHRITQEIKIKFKSEFKLEF